MTRQLLSRRQFTARCAALGLSLPILAASAQVLGASEAATGETSKPAGRTVKLPDGTTVPALGQGAWHLGQGRHPPAVEEEAVLTGVSLGMSLIDTSGNYGNGRSEQFLSHVIASQRERIFLVSKVEANEVSGDGISHACEASLARLGTDHLDLYLLHWPVSSRQFPGVVAAFEQLRAAGKIRAWGVSNFDRDQMDELFRVPEGHRCATNQVPYSLNNRRIERELLPWCMQHNVPLMAYSPLGGDHNLLVGDHTLAQIGAAHQCSAAAVALAWAIRSGKVIAIPESGSPQHTKENAAALSITLTPEDIQTLAAKFPRIARRRLTDSSATDRSALPHDIYLDDAVLEYPHSGERIRGRRNIQSSRANQPNKKRFAVRRIIGGGELWVTEFILTYDGKPSYTVSIMEFSGAKVVRETQYFADPFEPGTSRAQWVERMDVRSCPNHDSY